MAIRSTCAWLRRTLAVLCLAGLALFTAACQGETTAVEGVPILTSDVPGRLAQSRIFFAHQSVGENIVDGLKSLQTQNQMNGLNLVPLADASRATGPAFIHARLGSNGDPKSKTDAYEQALDAGLGATLDLAFQKYCFADFEADTNAEAVFDYYKQANARITQRYPNLTIVHVTAPLVTVQSGPRAVVKKWIGRVPDYYLENTVREQFNEMMRAEYGGTGHLFDLAKFEASAPGHSPEPILFRGRTLYSLRPEYTTDGGHLNSTTQRRVAADLATFLAGFLPARPALARTATN